MSQCYDDSSCIQHIHESATNVIHQMNGPQFLSLLSLQPAGVMKQRLRTKRASYILTEFSQCLTKPHSKSLFLSLPNAFM